MPQGNVMFKLKLSLFYRDSAIFNTENFLGGTSKKHSV